MIENFSDTKSAAKKLGQLSPRTLERWRVDGEGPAFRKFGKKVFYADSDLQSWADAQRRTPTPSARVSRVANRASGTGS